MKNALAIVGLVCAALTQMPDARATMQGSDDAGAAGAIDIQHRNVGCVVAGLHPRFDACMFDPAQLSRARLFFRAANTPYWYYVTMSAEPGASPGCLNGTLPKIKKSMTGQSIEVYLEAMDTNLGVNQIPPYSARVVANAGDCDRDVLAPAIPKASVVVGAAPGAPATPFGFVGGGISGATIGLGALGIAGLGAGAYALTSGDDSPTGGSPGGPPPGDPGPPPPVPPEDPDPTGGDEPPPTPEPDYRVISASVEPEEGEFGIPLKVKWQATSDCHRVRLALDDNDPFRLGLMVHSSLDIAEGDPGYPPSPGPYQYRVLCVEDLTVQRYTNVVNLTPPPTPDPQRPRRTLGSQARMEITMEMPDAQGFVLVNGNQTAYPRRGQTSLALARSETDTRVEGQVLRAARGGLWTFDLTTVAEAAPGSIRVLLGEVARITPKSVTFRMRGTPGERVAFTFGRRSPAETR